MPTERAKSHEGFEFGSEQFLAAVLYVARDAEKQFKRTRGGRFGRWWYLHKVRRQLELTESIELPYAVMRQELINFAKTFGVTDPAVIQSEPDAASVFDNIEE